MQALRKRRCSRVVPKDAHGENHETDDEADDDRTTADGE